MLPQDEVSDDMTDQERIDAACASERIRIQKEAFAEAKSMCGPETPAEERLAFMEGFIRGAVYQWEQQNKGD